MDTETFPEKATFDELFDLEKELFPAKIFYQRNEDQTPVSLYEKSRILAEYGKIICISVGFFNLITNHREFKVKTFFGLEKEVLIVFINLLETHFNEAPHLLCAHNFKEFDFPYIVHRMIIYYIEISVMLNLFNKKPWEVPHLDTLHLWHFRDYKHYTSFSFMTHVSGIPRLKDNIDGSRVDSIYYKEKKIDRIVNFSEKDVINIAKVDLLLRNKKIILGQ